MSVLRGALTPLARMIGGINARNASVIAGKAVPRLFGARSLCAAPIASGVSHEEFSAAKVRVEVMPGREMAYVDTGAPFSLDDGDEDGPVVVMLHGNPTSSWLYRDVIPGVQGVSRVLAPDLMGMGDSGKIPAEETTFMEQSKHLDAWFDAMGLSGDGPRDVLLVLHDWGSGLGFHWARRNEGRVAGIVHGESLVAPVSSWDEFPEGGRDIFQAMRSDAGESIVLEKNVFVERILPSSVLRKLSEEEMAGYLKPFLQAGEDRRPTLTWPRQIPVVGDDVTPPEVVAAIEEYAAWLKTTDHIPKVLLDAKPGFFAPWIREHTKDWPNHRVFAVDGLHFFQEDAAATTAAIVSGLAQSLRFGGE